MTVLSDSTIHTLLDNGELEVDPIDRPTQVQPSSIDLRLGKEIVPEATNRTETYDGEIKFEAGNSYLAHTREYISLPPYLSADVKGRSSIGRQFLQVHCAGWVDAGWEGQLTLEITNLGDRPKTLEVGDRVCQIVLKETDERPDRTYGEKGDAKYQGQMGATRSRFEGFKK